MLGAAEPAIVEGNRLMSIRFKRATRTGGWLALALSIVPQTAGATGAFRPAVDAAAETCRNSALALHPGNIERTQVLYGAKTVRIEVHIKQRDGKGWLVLCDGASGKVLNAIDVDAP
jgi:hypothetical protein